MKGEGFDIEKKVSVIASLLSVLLGVLFGFFLMLLLDKQAALTGMMLLLAGPFLNGADGISDILMFAVPILMTGLSVGFCFKCGLFNIGASGQFMMGGIVSICVGVNFSFLPTGIHCILALVAGALAGGIWGMIPGILKARRNVNEVISTLLLNYIALYLVNYMIQTFVYDSGKNQSLPVMKSARLFSVELGGAVFDVGIIIAIGIAFLLYFVMEKTTLGYELKICGRNRFAAQYSGMKENRLIVLSLTVGGMLSGIGGALMHLSNNGTFMAVSEKVMSQGFDGLSVALVAMSSPIGIVFMALFFGYVYVGGNMVQLIGFSTEVVGMIVAAIVYCGALVIPLRLFVRKILTRRG